MNAADNPYPRRWWTKRLLGTFVVLLILLTLTRLWWGWIAQRRLQRELDLISAAGEPIDANQVSWPVVANSDNAALIWKSECRNALSIQARVPGLSSLFAAMASVG
jgi:hypothetical protein